MVGLKSISQGKKGILRIASVTFVTNKLILPRQPTFLPKKYCKLIKTIAQFVKPQSKLIIGQKRGKNVDMFFFQWSSWSNFLSELLGFRIWTLNLLDFASCKAHSKLMSFNAINTTGKYTEVECKSPFLKPTFAIFGLHTYFLGMCVTVTLIYSFLIWCTTQGNGNLTKASCCQFSLLSIDMWFPYLAKK